MIEDMLQDFLLWYLFPSLFVYIFISSECMLHI